MFNKQCEARLKGRGIRPTAARILVLNMLAGQAAPVSLTELEILLETLDKSTISRTLTLLLEHHIIHAFEDGSGSMKYEICRSLSDTCVVSDRHVHFFCKICHKTKCLSSTMIPVVTLPEGYLVDSINYMVKGVCPECSRTGDNAITDE